MEYRYRHRYVGCRIGENMIGRIAAKKRRERKKIIQ